MTHQEPHELLYQNDTHNYTSTGAHGSADGYQKMGMHSGQFLS